MNRREFGQILFGGLYVSLLSPSILENKDKAINEPIKEIYKKKKLISEGWHRVMIEHVSERPSSKDGSILLDLSMKVLDEDGYNIHQIFTERFPYPILKVLEKAKLKPIDGVIDLDLLKGKEISVKVEKIFLGKKEFRVVRD